MPRARKPKTVQPLVRFDDLKARLSAADQALLNGYFKRVRREGGDAPDSPHNARAQGEWQALLEAERARPN